MITTRRFLVSIGAAAALGTMACDPDKLTEVNKNPNNPTDAPTGTLFTSAVRASTRWLDGVNLPRYSFLSQHTAEVQYPESDQYVRLRASGTSGTLNNSFNNELQDFHLVMSRGLSAPAAGTYGPAMVMKTWELGIITDTWGDIPYSQAFRADSGILLPRYDAQKDIYADFFATLTKAAADLGGAQNTLGASDPVYGGNPARWQKFANSLRARHALRLINVDPATAAAQLQGAFNAPGGLITSNADNATLVWPGDGLNDHPWATNFKGRDDHRVSDDLIALFRATQDPRVHVLAMRAEVDAPEVPGRTVRYCPDATTPCYVGLANALTHANAAPNLPSTSRVGARFYPGATAYGTFGGGGASHPSFFITAAEVAFIRAEAAERAIAGLTAAQAKGFYEEGIRLSMAQFGVTDAAAIATFLARPGVAYAGGVEGLKQIARQKWVALFTDPLQAWAEFRRTCQPSSIKPGPAAIEDAIPRRLQYSTNEYATNRESITEAVTRQGADNFRTRIYWDKSPAVAPTYEAGCGTR